MAGFWDKVVNSSFFASRPFSVGIKPHRNSLGDTKALLTQATKLRADSPLSDYDDVSFAADVINQALRDTDVEPSEKIISGLFDVLSGFYHDEALAEIGADALAGNPSSREGIALREYLRRQIRFLRNYDHNMTLLQNHLTLTSRYLMTELPLDALTDKTDGAFLTLPYTDLLENTPEVIQTLIGGTYSDELRSANILDPFRARIDSNMLQVSRIDPDCPPANKYRYLVPTEVSGLTNEEIVDGYLLGTPYRSFFKLHVPLSIAEDSRFEHSHILAGTGHGKTQFIQKWVTHDIERACREKRSVVVIDSQGDLISKISRLDVFDPQHGALRDKLVIIDPTDVQFPAAINMFSLDENRLSSYGAAEREKVQNSAIELYEHFFGELLGAELTAKQGVVFKYLARLMLEIPDATILTLRDLMDDHTPFIPYMDKLTGSARVFFAREFLDRSFNQTKKQISKRLWGVLSTPAFERLFSSASSKIDLFSLMNNGSVILISTAKDLLKQQGSALYGRFFLSMLGQAIVERAVIPENERTPTFLYIDECHEYFDENIEMLLAQGRKYKVGLTLAHQFMDQLPRSAQGSVLANTSIKASGGVNAKDARLLSQEMQTTSDFLTSMRKSEWDTEFAFWMKHTLPEAIKVTVPFGFLEQQPQMNLSDLEIQLERNRERYCWRYEPQDSSATITFPTMKPPAPDPVPEQPEPAPMLKREHEPPPTKTRGGKEHTAIQTALKSLANQYGWRAEVEYAVDDGFVDVWLTRNGMKIACEITVTTPIDYEIQNIQKCRKAGADEVWVISENRDKLSDIEANLSETTAVLFLTPDDLPAEIESRSEVETSEGVAVCGFTVSLKRAVVSQEDRKLRKQRLQALLKSVS